MIKRFSSSVAIVGLLLSQSPAVFAATTLPSVTIQQVSPTTKLGSWALSYQGGNVKSSDPGINLKTHTLYPAAGLLVLMFTPPGGASTRVSVFKNGELVDTKLSPQLNIQTETGASYKFIAQYTFDKLGTIGVTSVPSGQSFKLVGPDNTLYRGTTPMTFKNVPAGNYKLTMNAMKDCILPSPAYRKIKASERLVLNITYNCGTTVSAPNRGISKRDLMNATDAREAARAAALKARQP